MHRPENPERPLIGDPCTLLQVFDMPTSIRFYRDILGFQAVSPVPPDDQCDWVMLRMHDAELMLNTAYEADDRPESPDPVRVASHADTSLFLFCPDLDAAQAYLRSSGVEVGEPATQSYGMRQLYMKDPDGYEICLQHPVDSR
jgi:catechol 2,3-dioxygenase-like lactoylglutathione lyase family enzyme